LSVNQDNFPIYLALVFSTVALMGYVVCAVAGKARFGWFLRTCYFVAAVSVTYSFIYLLQQILSCARYDIAYIYHYTAPVDPLIYQIAAVWVGPEGCFLLWAVVTGLFGVALTRRVGAWGMALWTLMLGCGLTILTFADPFAPKANYSPGAVGVGANPLLANPWIAAQAPIALIGYASACVPAVLCVDSLICNSLALWPSTVFSWTLLACVANGVAIGLGMRWSYEVLGNATYWNWDPTEVAALAVWIALCVLLHLLFVAHKRRYAMAGSIVVTLAILPLAVYAATARCSGVLSIASEPFPGISAVLSCAVLLWFLLGGVLVGVKRRAVSTVSEVALKRPPEMARNLAHTGAVILVLGMMLSCTGRPRTLVLTEGSPGHSVYGYRLSYEGRHRLSLDKDGFVLGVRRGDAAFLAPLSIAYGATSCKGVAKTPFIESTITHDLYISAVKTSATTVVPTASISSEGWYALPVTIPGSESSLTLIGMQVDEGLAKLQYTSSDFGPVDVLVRAGKPARVDGYTLTFVRFVGINEGSGGASHGVQIAVKGRGLKESIVARVILVPFMWLIWAGVIIVVLGMLVALYSELTRRRGDIGELLPCCD